MGGWIALAVIVVVVALVSHRLALNWTGSAMRRARVDTSEVTLRELWQKFCIQHRVRVGVPPERGSGERKIGPGRYRDDCGRKRQACLRSLERHSQSFLCVPTHLYSRSRSYRKHR